MAARDIGIGHLSIQGAMGLITDIAELAAAGAAGFKVSTIEVDPVRFPRIPDGRLYEAFQEIAGTRRPVAAHQENQEIIFSQAEAFRAARARGVEALCYSCMMRPAGIELASALAIDVA